MRAHHCRRARRSGVVGAPAEITSKCRCPLLGGRPALRAAQRPAAWPVAAGARSSSKNGSRGTRRRRTSARAIYDLSLARCHQRLEVRAAAGIADAAPDQAPLGGGGGRVDRAADSRSAARSPARAGAAPSSRPAARLIASSGRAAASVTTSSISVKPCCRCRRRHARSASGGGRAGAGALGWGRSRPRAAVAAAAAGR